MKSCEIVVNIKSLLSLSACSTHIASLTCVVSAIVELFPNRTVIAEEKAVQCFCRNVEILLQLQFLKMTGAIAYYRTWGSLNCGWQA